MRLPYLMIFLLCIVSCKKPDNGPDATGSPSETPIIDDQVNTRITAYFPFYPNGTEASLKIDNNLTIYKNSQWTLNNPTALNRNRSYFDFTPLNYSTLLNGVSVNAIQSFRNVALTDAPRNYVDLNFPLMAWIGPFYFSAPLSGELNMPGGGKLKYTAKSSDIPSSGFWSAGGLFMDPKALGFAITNPDFSVDVSGKRWYMRPWGIMGLSLKLPFVASGGAQLVFPIPKELRTIAPDSIETWNYTNQHWVYKGYALKSDTNYIKKIDNDGLWSFGIHQKGVYKTFRLRTPEGIPLPNALIRITDSFGELGAARSDVDGNAVLFLPIGESMNLELLPYWSAANFPRDKVLTQPIAPFDANADITITVPDTSPYLATVKGTAKTCNGDAIKNGTVRITFNDSTPFFHIPVRNGLFQAALINSGPPRYRVFLINDDTGESDRDTAVYTEIGKTTLLYLNTCHKPTNTFVHYSMDGISYSIEGDALHPESPALNAYTSIAGPYHTLFSCAKNPGAGGEKFQFETSVTNTGNYTGSGFNAIYVNDSYYSYDINKPVNLTITRYDILPGGFIEGSMDVWCKRDTGVSHHLQSSFRVLIRL